MNTTSDLGKNATARPLTGVNVIRANRVGNHHCISQSQPTLLTSTTPSTPLVAHPTQSDQSCGFDQGLSAAASVAFSYKQATLAELVARGVSLLGGSRQQQGGKTKFKH